MGLINPDEHVTGTGVIKTNTYISFNSETIYLAKQGTDYRVHANYRIFWDKDAKDAGKSFMELNSVAQSITEADLGSNLYGILYAELKTRYPNAVDDLL